MEWLFGDAIPDAIKDAALSAGPQIQALQDEYNQLTDKIAEAKANADRLALRDIHTRSIKIQNEITGILEAVIRSK